MVVSLSHAGASRRRHGRCDRRVIGPHISPSPEESAMPDGKGIVMRLETDRLIIDHFTGSDVSMWAEIKADPDVRRFVDGQ